MCTPDHNACDPGFLCTNYKKDDFFLDTRLTMEQKLYIAKAALKIIKDAPSIDAEISETCEDALYLMTYGFEDIESIGTWGRSFYGKLPLTK